MSVASIHLDPRNSWRFVTGALLAITCAAFFWYPMALLIFACLIAVVTPTDNFKWLLLAAACALFTILNVSKQLDGDLVTYVYLQDYVSEKPLYTLFHKEELQLISDTYRLTEIGFYGPLWVMSQVIPDSKTALSIASTLGIYIPTFLGVTLIGRTEKWSQGLVVAVLIFTFFAGINFVQTTHLIRQYISGALLFYAFALLLSERTRWGALVALYACTVHNGTALLIPVVGVFCWSFRYREGAKLGPGGIFIRIVCIVGVLSATIVIVPILQSEFLKEDIPNIKAGHFLVVGTLYVIAFVAIEMQHLRHKSLHYARLAFLATYILSLGFFILGLPLFALRYFAYLEWLYGIMVGAIMFTWFRHRPALQMFARFTLCLAAATILVVRVGVAEWMYGPGDNYLLSWDFFQVTQLVSR